MKRAYISASLLFLIILFCAFSFSFLKKNITAFDSILYECLTLTEGGSPLQAAEKIEQATLFWEEKKSSFSFFLDLNHCRSIENCLEAMTFMIKEAEYTDAKNAINECRDILLQIMESESFSPDIIL